MMKLLKKEKGSADTNDTLTRCPRCGMAQPDLHALTCPRCLEELPRMAGCAGCGRCGRRQ